MRQSKVKPLPAPPAPPAPAIPILLPLTRPRLLLRPAAFLKLTYLCHAASTEVGGFGLSSDADPLVIEDIVVVRQDCTAVTVAFDDTAVADHIDAMADRGVPPQRCSRVWVHTHPGSSASPSGTDERTFARSFGGADFSVMLILARGGAWYARLQLTGPVKTAVEIPVVIDWSDLPAWLDAHRDTLPERIGQWAQELQTLVRQPTVRAFAGLELVDGADEPVPRGWWDDAPGAFYDDADFEPEAADERDYLL